MKKEHVKQGFLWTDALEVELRDGVRSCERGMGPPKKARPLELGMLAAHGSLEPLVPGGSGVAWDRMFGGVMVAA
eukprot:6467277-Amphidinium_carterae.2